MKLVVPLDGSVAAESALRVAQELAEAMEAEVVLLHVIEHDPLASATLRSSEEATQYLRAREAAFVSPVRSRVVEGRTAIQGILSIVREEAADLVILTTHGTRSHPDVPLGSVARELPHLCSAPVVLVGSSVQK